MGLSINPQTQGNMKHYTQDIETLAAAQNIDEKAALKLARFLYKFRNWLDDSSREWSGLNMTNGEYSRYHSYTEKEAFEEAGLQVSDLLDLAPKELFNKYDDFGIAEDLLWAEDLLNDEYYR